jgi:uncharacterized protein YcbX
MSIGSGAPTGSPLVRRIYRYPVKSMLGELVPEADVDGKGLAGDRAFAVVDAERATVASAKLPRRWARLLEFRATYVEPPALDGSLPPVLITFPDGSTKRSDDTGTDAALSAALGSPVRLVKGVHDHTMPYQATDGEGSVLDTEKAGSIGRLGPPDRFFDLSALHVLTTSTLEHLRQLEPAADFDERRFRPNLVLETADPGFAEDDWVGQVLELEQLRIEIVRRTARCVMPTLAQKDLGLDRLTLKAIARYHRVESPPTVGPSPCAGVYATVEGHGVLRIGDALQLRGPRP